MYCDNSPTQVLFFLPFFLRLTRCEDERETMQNEIRSHIMIKQRKFCTSEMRKTVSLILRELFSQLIALTVKMFRLRWKKASGFFFPPSLKHRYTYFWFFMCRKFPQRDCTRNAYIQYANIFLYILCRYESIFWKKERAYIVFRTICLSTYDVICTSHTYSFTLSYTIHTCIHNTHIQSTDRSVGFFRPLYYFRTTAFIDVKVAVTL